MDTHRAARRAYPENHLGPSNGSLLTTLGITFLRVLIFMSFLDRIAEWNRHDAQRYVPFHIDAAQVGAVRRDRLRILAGYP